MSSRGFGDLEAVVIERIWDRSEKTDGSESAEGSRKTTVRELFDELAGERDIAYTTVMSTMDNLHRKGWLERERVGKAYRYWPTLSREEYSARLMREALGSGGRSELVLAHFVEQMSAEESEGLRAALRKLTRTKPRS